MASNSASWASGCNCDNTILGKEIEERARLDDWLLVSLELPAHESWFDDLDFEVKARMAAAQNGEMVTVDGEQMLGRKWNLLRK